MHPAVLRVWHEFSEPLEGRTLSPYLDVKGLVTVGVGNLIDPISAALRLPWKIDGRRATEQEIRDDWQRLKARQDLAQKHWRYAAEITRIRLTDDDVDALVTNKLASNQAELRRHFPDFDAWPADAQLGVLSMAWALGPSFSPAWPNFTGYARKQDWLGCSASCGIRTVGNAGVIPRNRANVLCFGNAAIVALRDMDRAVLHWPDELTLENTLPRSEQPTHPEGRVFVGSTDGELRAEATEAAQSSTATLINADRTRNLSESDTDPAPPPESERLS